MSDRVARGEGSDRADRSDHISPTRYPRPNDASSQSPAVITSTQALARDRLPVRRAQRASGISSQLPAQAHGATTITGVPAMTGAATDPPSQPKIRATGVSGLMSAVRPDAPLLAPARVALIVYDGMTAIDMIGVYDPLTRLPSMGFLGDVTWMTCSPSKRVRASGGLTIVVDESEGTLEDYNILIVPGGPGARGMAQDTAFISWLQTARDARIKASMGAGALLLGAAGFLAGRRATTVPSAYETLESFCSEVVKSQRIVEGEGVVTSRGITAAIDIGLFLCIRVAGQPVSERIRMQMDYR